MKTEEFIQKYLEETSSIAKAIDISEVRKFIDILFSAWKSNKKIFTAGNGGSAGNASHFVADLAKTVFNSSSFKELNQSKKGFRAMCLNENSSLVTAWVNDCGWDSVYEGQLYSWIEEGDVLLLLSVHGGSGWSGNIVKAMQLAKSRNAKIIGIAGYDGGKLKEMADACVLIPKDSTPHVEGYQGIIQHLVIWRLKGLIENYEG
jgi:D-sedoheptulose 7-phosphate isomerase